MAQKNVIFEITQRCNHACPYCYNVWEANRAYPDGELCTAHTVKLLEKIIDETGCINLTITGGEPAMREDLADIIKAAGKKVKNIILITNGALLDRSRVKELISAGVSLFEVALQSADPAVYRELSGGADNHAKVVETILDIKELGGYVVTVFVATKTNLPGLHDTLKLNTALGVHGMMFNRVNIGGRGIKNAAKLMPSAEELRNALSLCDSFSGQYGLSISCSIPMMPCVFDMKKYPRLGYGFCLGGKGEDCYYTFDGVGNVRICNHSDFILGNITMEKFTSIITHPYVSGFRSALPTYCSNCPEATLCQGGCKAASEVSYGDLAEEEPFLRTIPFEERVKPVKASGL